MIVARDWVWMHFPKCGGTSAEALLRKNFGDDPSVSFDPLDRKNVIWHHNIAKRKEYDPAFTIDGRRVVAVFRRLPYWLLSRVHFEASRAPHRIASREMIVKGQFYENSGYINSCERTLLKFLRPRVDYWVRIENMHEDFETFFARKLVPLGEVMREAKTPYIKNTDFWFRKDELKELYEANPTWAELEMRLYGSLLD